MNVCCTKLLLLFGIITLCFLNTASSFVPLSLSPISPRTQYYDRSVEITVPLAAAARDSSGNEDLDSLRSLLEASWNADSMGQVPSTSDAAAVEAVSALLKATEDGIDIFFIDLLLPAYDITQGTNYYDEVLAVEFCISLANNLRSKSSIIVRDDDTIKAVSRILDARERDRLEELEKYDDYNDDEEDDDDDDEDDDDDDDNNEDLSSSSESTTSIEFYDDFADFGDIGGASSIISEEPSNKKSTSTNSDKNNDDVEDFRAKLSSTWDSPTAEEIIIPPKEELTLPPRSWRLCSMFGSAKIENGPDMLNDVVSAVRENAQPTEEEETMIILSACDRQEMIAVRSLAAKHGGKKKIILVNSKLEPTPREVLRGETVYSILPLIAKSRENDRSLFRDQANNEESNSQEEEKGIKIVVLRRYPNDWQVFVDDQSKDSSGFELAGSVVASRVSKKGPQMEWIAECVKRYIQSKTME